MQQGTQGGLRQAAMAFPGDDGGQSLAALAQRDLDATLQLLADRALYITGSSGAAIALRRGGKNDMLCRATTGSNAPELGTLLSTEFGISGESVRSRLALRCDDAERDPRVNRDGCRQLGIASVVVMPVVHDDEVLGVFELFSGKANAFGERDLSALQRLSEMVETAVKLSQAAEGLPERLLKMDVPEAPTADAAPVFENIEIQDPIVEVEAEPVVAPEIESAAGAEAVISEVVVAVPETVTVEMAVPVEAPVESIEPVPCVQADQAIAVEAAPVEAKAEVVVEPAIPAKKALFWSASMVTGADAQKPAEADRSHVPPVMRSLKTCMTCGFPVSPGRTLCVECEEKKWRGQLRARQGAAMAPSAIPKPVRAVAAAAAAPALAPLAPEPKKEAVVAAPAAPVAVPEFVLSAGLAPSQGWFARNKFVVGAIVVVAAAVVAVLFLR